MILLLLASLFEEYNKYIPICIHLEFSPLPIERQQPEYGQTWSNLISCRGGLSIL